MAEQTRQCKDCNQVKPIEDFSSCKLNGFRLTSCKSCIGKRVGTVNSLRSHRNPLKEQRAHEAPKAKTCGCYVRVIDGKRFQTIQPDCPEHGTFRLGYDRPGAQTIGAGRARRFKAFTE